MAAVPESNGSSTSVEESQKQQLDVQPTLFIALGGTGMEVLQRLRTRILGTVWGSTDKPHRISGLSEFPVAEFLYIDLDQTGVNVAGDMGKKQQLFENQVRFSQEEKITESLNAAKYFSSENEIESFEHIVPWMPLTRKKFNELKIPLDQGGAQIRSLARLYFFDKFETIQGRMIAKTNRLKAGITYKTQTDRLGLKVDTGSIRVVVVNSIAGGTGAGTFIDMGYLAQIVAGETGKTALVQSLLVLPGAYAAATNKGRTEANAYSSLMELETLMSEKFNFVKTWERNGAPVSLPDHPYNDIFLCDMTNVVGEGTGDKNDVYRMLADILFEDFTSSNAAKRKRSTASNTTQHKSGSYAVDMSTKFGKLNLGFSQGFSAFGQFVIDTQLEDKRNIVLATNVNAMLVNYFGIVNDDLVENSASEKARDSLLEEYLYLQRETYTLAYQYAGHEPAGFENGVEQQSFFSILSELLRIDDQSLPDTVGTDITKKLNEIRSGDKDQWLENINLVKKQLRRDAFKAPDNDKCVYLDRLHDRQKEIYLELVSDNGKLINHLWSLVDNHVEGGVAYTADLILRVQDRLENADTGIITALEKTEQWFEDLSSTIEKDEVRILEEHLRQIKGGGLFSFNKETQAEAKLNQLGESLTLWISSHLRAEACRNAILILKDLSARLGRRDGTTVDGTPIWKGFIGELKAGQGMVQSIMREMKREIDAIEAVMKNDNATYKSIPNGLKVEQNISVDQAKQWAAETFAGKGGTRGLFKEMANKESRDILVGELRNIALSHLPEDIAKPKVNPLFAALDQYPDIDGLFETCIRRAMPWVDANLDIKNRGDRYSCIIGVADVGEFSERYGAQFIARAPGSAGFQSSKIQFLESGIPGKLTCYIEFSGMPLTTLRQLRNWRNSYNKQKDSKIPCHIHKDAALFKHPIAPTREEVDQSAYDYQVFIQAVAIGVLKPRKGTDEYEVKIKKNDFSIGSERTVRLDGFLDGHQPEIERQMTEALKSLGSPYQLAGLEVIFSYYVNNVFKARLETNPNKSEFLTRGIGYQLSCDLLDKFKAQFEADAMAQNVDQDSIRTALEAKLDAWTNIIPGSEQDGYLNEVAIDRKAKRVVKSEFFIEGWLEQLVNQKSTAKTTATLPLRFRAFINKKQERPWSMTELAQQIDAGVVEADTKVWNMAWDVKVDKWQMAGEVPELQGFFVPDPIDDAIPDPE